MSEVRVVVDGATYRVDCEPGDEAHLKGLAVQFDRTVASLKTRLGPIGNRRIAVMAGLTVLDRLVSAEAEIATLRQRIAALEHSRETVVLNAGEEDEALIERIEGLTETIEALTATITGTLRREAAPVAEVPLAPAKRPQAPEPRTEREPSAAKRPAPSSSPSAGPTLAASPPAPRVQAQKPSSDADRPADVTPGRAAGDQRSESAPRTPLARDAAPPPAEADPRRSARVGGDAEEVSDEAASRPEGDEPRLSRTRISERQSVSPARPASANGEQRIRGPRVAEPASEAASAGEPSFVVRG